MSMCTLGLAEAFKSRGVAVNSLWPETGIATSAIKVVGAMKMLKNCRTPEIVADAAYWILSRPAIECTGNFFVDAKVLEQSGVTDLSKYAVEPGHELLPAFYLGQKEVKSTHAGCPL